MSLLNQVLKDLEKRHASESELNSLPPFVRAVPSRPRSLAKPVAIVVAVLLVIAIAVFLLAGSRRTDDVVATQSVTKPISMPTPEPVAPPKPSPVAPAPVEETAKGAPTYSPVSRLSDELTLVAPSTARKEKEKSQPVARVEKPAAVTPEPVKAIPAPVAPPAVPEKTQNRAADESRAKAVPADVPSPAPLAANDGSSAIDKQMRESTSGERAELAFRKGVTQIQEGRANAAELDFREALKQDPAHAGARQALLGLLLDSGRNGEAEQLLHKALEINPRQPRHAMVLARLEVERGEVTGAINTMVAALPYVQSDPEFYAFLAALLQREGRHREAADYYRGALRLAPGNGVWMMGLGISLRGSNQSADARDAFQHALDSKQLNPDLQDFVERQLRELGAQKKR